MPEIEARFLHLQSQAVEAVQLLPQVPEELLNAMRSATSPSALADLASAYMDVSPEEKQEILETIDIGARMEKVSRMLAHRIEVLRLSQEIGRSTKKALDDRQREVLLREQMAAIQRQLGEGEDGKAAEIAELSTAITKAAMPKDIEEQARKELRRLERMQLRVDAFKQNLTAQFTAMEKVVAGLKASGSFLSQQMASISSSK